jgi:tripartite ATP-independent transporter DctP family solute receptor
MFKRRTLVSALAGAALLVATSAFAQYAERTIKFTNGVNEDHSVSVGVRKMQEVLNAKTGGKMKINAFWGGSAGGDLAGAQATRAGTQEIVCTSGSALTGIVKELGVLDLPFLFNSEKEAYTVLDGQMGKYLNKKLEEAGLVNLAYWENGFRNLTNSRRPVGKIEDFDGIKLRVMQSSIYLDTFKTLGANPTPMAFGEVFTSLETKTIDGQENPFSTIETAKLYEVQKYLSVTRHVYSPFFVLYSKKLWDQLNPQEQAVLREAALEGQTVQRDASRAQDQKSLAILKTKGMLVNEFSPAEKARVMTALKPVYDKHVNNIGAGAVNLMMDSLKKARGG